MPFLSLRSLVVAAVAVCALAHALPAHGQQIYIGGNFRSQGWVASPANLLYDDGLHNDGAAGDGEYGVDLVADQPAGMYSWNLAGLDVIDQLMPFWPDFMASARVFTTVQGEVLHFRYFGSGTPGWVPSGPLASVDQAIPTGASLVLEYGWQWPYPIASVPMTWNGTYWECVATIPTAQPWAYQFRCVGGAAPASLRFTRLYNSGSSLADEYAFQFTTLADNSDVRFQFDPRTGQARAVELGSTPTRNSTWGAIKSLYR